MKSGNTSNNSPLTFHFASKHGQKVFGHSSGAFSPFRPVVTVTSKPSNQMKCTKMEHESDGALSMGALYLNDIVLSDSDHDKEHGESHTNTVHAAKQSSTRRNVVIGSSMAPRTSSSSTRTPVAASPLLQPAGSPWGPIGPPTTSITALGNMASNNNDEEDDDDSHPKATTTPFTAVNISSLTVPVTSDPIKPASPTESRTSDSSLGVAEVHTRRGTHQAWTRHKTTMPPRQQPPPPPPPPPRRPSPRTQAVKPHVFLTPSPDETSDPEEQNRRKEARAKEQQQLILERVQTARQEKEKEANRKKPKSSRPTVLRKKKQLTSNKNESIDGSMKPHGGLRESNNQSIPNDGQKNTRNRRKPNEKNDKANNRRKNNRGKSNAVSSATKDND